LVAGVSAGKESLGVSPLAMSTTSLAISALSFGRAGCFGMRGKLISGPKTSYFKLTQRPVRQRLDLLPATAYSYRLAQKASR
jgi:hypothetical protein